MFPVMNTLWLTMNIEEKEDYISNIYWLKINLYKLDMQ